MKFESGHWCFYFSGNIYAACRSLPVTDEFMNSRSKLVFANLWLISLQQVLFEWPWWLCLTGSAHSFRASWLRKYLLICLARCTIPSGCGCGSVCSALGGSAGCWPIDQANLPVRNFWFLLMTFWTCYSVPLIEALYWNAWSQLRCIMISSLGSYYPCLLCFWQVNNLPFLISLI